MSWYNRLKEERKRLKIKQKDFAEELEMSVQGIIQYEKGARKPSLEYIDALIKKGADIQYIYTGVRSENLLSDELKEIIRLYSEASESIKSAVKTILLNGTNPQKIVDFGKNNNLQNSKIKISQ